MVQPLRGLALVFLAAFVAAGAAAQTPFQFGFPSMARTSGPVGTESDLALEGALDEAIYVVGPGDVFVFAIGGSSPRQMTSTVSADGRLIVPEAGSFDVADRTLGSVRTQVRAALGRQFRNVTTDVALASPRRFSVHVSGAVPEPGRHVVRAVARVEDALAMARPEPSLTPGGRRFVIDLDKVYTAPPSSDLEARPAYRNVLVRHADGTEDRVDLARYLVTGDVTSNPYLRDGDAIFLPTFDPSREGVFVGGSVIHRGVYDVRPDDTALSVLTVASGGQPETTIQAVRVTRAVNGQVTEVPLARASEVRVGPRDQVFAITLAPEAGTAAAVGALRYPGTYPIRSGETTLASLVEMAGGLTDEALLRGAYLERHERSEPLETRDDIGGDPLDLLEAPVVSRF
ncbi:MAG: SLBB domain-containing protein, partial [Bacteroidota bacterium]